MNSIQIIQADLIDMAGNMLEQQDAKDMKLSLLELTGVAKHGIPTGTGLNDLDYQNLSTLSMGYKNLTHIQSVNKVPIPTEILEHFKHIKCHCMMGLFPEIGRAWLTIDSEIYIWTYEHPRDVAYYDGLNHLIVSVGLVKPKAGVFINDVKYLLILTTPSEVIILGVTFNDMTKTISSPNCNKQNTSTFEEMQLMSKPIFIVNTDSVSINVIEGTVDGRIFLGGRDGCLYEISYQAESSWFGKRCRKINHSQGLASYMVPNFIKAFTESDPIVRISIDNSRKLLYVLTEKGSIEAWCLGNNSIMRRFSKITQNEIAQTASNIIKTIDPSAFKPIKAICPISFEECSDLHLIAVTQFGVRLYFTTSELQITESGRQQHIPKMSHSIDERNLQRQTQHETNGRLGLFLLHVRLPPGYTPNTTINKPKQVHSAFYDEGTLLFVSTPQQEQDILWCISSTPFPNRPYLTESTTVFPLDGIVWGLSGIKNKCEAKLPSILRKSQITNRIVLLTNQGVHIIALLKPIDILQQLLIACHGPHHEAVKAFFAAQTEREACATCLSIACAERFRGSDLAIWAAQAFMLYGGEPLFQKVQSAINTDTTRHMMTSGLGGVCDRNIPQMHVSTPLPTGNITPIYRPMSTQSNTQQSQYMLSPITNETNLKSTKNFSNFQYSGKHDGLYIYFARLIRSIWKMPCIGKNLNSMLPLPDCTLILEDLYAIKGFLEANCLNEFACALNSYGNQTTVTTNYTQIVSNEGNEQKHIVEQAQNEEKRSIAALTYFIKHSCQVFGLWKILCEHQLHLLINQLTNEQKDILKSCTFSDLILSRSDICAVLIVALINSYLKDNSSVSSVSTKLREVCPNLYRHEDAVAFKATEILMNSRNCSIPEEKSEKLRTALQLCKDAAPNLPLPNICQQFIHVGFYEGVIQLSSTCAAKIDPEEIGIHFYNNNEPVEDRQGYAAFAARMTCYKEVRLMFDQVYQSVSNDNASKEFNAVKSVQNRDILSNKIMEIVALAMQINDPLLHISVYEWLMINNMRSELLTLFEPTLGEYLRRNVIRNSQNLNVIDLLWKYYEKNGHHSQAAHILNDLAMSNNESIKLEQRIEYLARAVMCMRNDCVGYSISNGVLLKELEDKLEIARVQKIILDSMMELGSTNRNADLALQDLNNTLYDITDLYHKFADPYNLWECKLTILNCSHHNDPLLVESVWSQILSKAVDGNDSVSERSIRLFAKVESLVKEFRESGHCFPLAFLIRELEVKACQLRLPEGIILEKLVKMEIDIELLMEYYSRMISMNERIWANEGNDWHLVHSAIRLVTLVVSNSQSIWYRSKRRIIGKAQDIITICLNLCYQKPDTNSMQDALKELQCQLQRIS